MSGRSKNGRRTNKRGKSTGGPSRLRARAEMLMKDSAGKIAKLPQNDARRLTHELEVHQIELEMQNNELRRTQVELEAARDRFSRLYDFAPVGHVTLDESGAIVEANLTATVMLEAGSRGLTGKKLAELIIPAYRDSLLRHLARVQTALKAERCQLMVPRRGGGGLMLEATTVSVFDEERQRNEFFMTLTDVTERRRAEDERAKLAAIVESSGDAIISQNRLDLITSWNRGAEQMLGYLAEEIVGRSFDLLTPPELRPEQDRVSQRVLGGEQIDHLETTLLAKDGRKILVSAAISPLRDSSGGITGISAIMRDVTRQREAEEGLRQSERSLADFFTESPLGLLWVGPNGRILRVNRAFLELLGSAHQDLLGHPVTELHADAEIAADLVARLARGETVQNYRVRLRQSNGSLLHVLIDANGLWEKTTLVHSRWFVRDITRRVELEREILAIVEREQHRLGQDLHDDLGQQLAGTEFLAQTLAGQLAASSRPAAARAKEIARMVQRTMVRTRELARGLAPISLEPDGLMAGLRELAARVKKLFRIDCRFRCKTPVPVHDRDVGIHLYRIAQEAVNNAVKHGKARRIDIGLTATGDRIILAVSDNGIGLPKKPRNKKGLGLRLMQYRAGVIDASLVAQRLPNGGTTFVCTVRDQQTKKGGKP
jgi:PAS domain S-box-containing protein